MDTTKTKGQILQDSLHAARRAKGLLQQSAHTFDEAALGFKELPDPSSNADYVTYTRIAKKLKEIHEELQKEV